MKIDSPEFWAELRAGRRLKLDGFSGASIAIGIDGAIRWEDGRALELSRVICSGNWQCIREYMTGAQALATGKTIACDDELKLLAYRADGSVSSCGSFGPDIARWLRTSDRWYVTKDQP